MNKKLSMNTALKYVKAAGIEVHADFILVAYRAYGEIKLAEFPNTTDGIEQATRFMLKRSIKLTCMESTGCYHCGIYFALKAARIRVILLNPAKSRSISPHKTDERDAIWLLRLAETRLIEGSYMPDDKIFELRILTRRRMKIADTIANLKKSLMSVLEAMGVKIRELSKSARSSSIKRFLDDILRGELGKYRKQDIAEKLFNIFQKSSPELIRLVKSYIVAIKSLEKVLESIDKTIRDAVEDYIEEIKILMSVPGVSFKLAASILAEIGDVNRFDSPEKLVSYAGLVPSVYQSGGKTRLRGTVRSCNIYLRRVMFLVAFGAMRSKSKIVQDFVSRLKARGKHFKVIVIALARKLLRIIWYLLRRREKWCERLREKRIPPRARRSRVTIEEAVRILREAGYIVVRCGEGMQAMV